ncbi:MAG: uroporphyrinogen decarboxylase family protein [candidate division Zixibacteria bacterium]|nr:uroporphyrinogen decarboxylase family protein [candidate division Zixibacteria bacterium]
MSFKSKLSHRDRIASICAGEKPDRYAGSMWRHFYHMEHHAEGTIEAMLMFQRQFDWDFMKINPRADYHIEDWGLKQTYSRNEFVKHVKTSFPVKNADDWLKLQVLPPTSPALAEHLQVVSEIRRRSDRELPLFMTVFTPLAIAGRMVEKDEMLAEHIRSAPDKVLAGIETITKTFETYVGELRNAGADGLFFATTSWASSNLITWEEYQRFGIPFDLRILKATESSALNLFHICSNNNFLPQLAKENYPVQMINWNSADPTNIPLDKAYDIIKNKALVGGIDHDGWARMSDPSEVSYLVKKLLSHHDPSRLILGPGCTIPPETPIINIKTIRESLG